VPRTQNRLAVAPIGRRLLAGGIDASCILSAIAAALAAALFWGWREKDTDGGGLAPLQHWNAWSKSPLWRCGALVYAVGLRSWRTPGMRVMGIRRVDARTGGPVTVRSALIRHLAEQSRGVIVERFVAPRFRRAREPVEALQADVRAAERAHPDDQAARLRATMDVYGSAGVTPWAGCLPLTIPLVAEVVFTLLTPRRQSPNDWIAGIVVIKD
jgi:uncharacterized RDD family membrane protein YckC